MPLVLRLRPLLLDSASSCNKNNLLRFPFVMNHGGYAARLYVKLCPSLNLLLVLPIEILSTAVVIAFDVWLELCLFAGATGSVDIIRSFS